MRVLQLIDSLEVGGAETLAVNYANALSEKIECSALVATRKEGELKENIDSKVVFACLQKKSALDLNAISKLKNFVSQNRIGIIHAHGTSFFMACIIKILCPKIKVIWHEHYGARAIQSRNSNFVLWMCSLLFSHIFVVNDQLKDWMCKHLSTKKVDYIPNFASFPKIKRQQTTLLGKSGKRIVCLANLKDPKNHLFLLQAFNTVKANFDNFDWSLHFIGKDFGDDYSDQLKHFIQTQQLQETVFLYSLKTDVEHILSQAEIGILASTHEGFPVALLEYRLAGIPVLSTNAGFCSSIINDTVNGLLFDPKNRLQLEQQLYKMITDAALRGHLRENTNLEPGNDFSEEKVIALLISKYSGL